MIQLLYLVHGMGCGARTDGSEWFDDVRDKLEEVLAPYADGGKPFKDRLTWTQPKAGAHVVWVRPATYHDVFDEFRKDTEDLIDANDLDGMLQRLDLDGRVDVRTRDALASAGDFFWTHVLDVLLYRFVPDAGTTPIRTQVGNAIVQDWRLAQELNGGVDTPAHFVAHSLGTAVLHDTMSGKVSEAFGAGARRAASLHTLANVAKVLETDFGAYDSPCRPLGTSGAPGAMVVKYVESRHELDPIPLVDGFNPVAWGSKRYSEVVLRKVLHWNVHGYTHYLSDPRAHFPIFSALWRDFDWNARFEAAKATFDAAAPVGCPAELGVLRERLQEIINEHSDAADQPVMFVRELAETWNAIETARAACGKSVDGSET
jgi:hypothetical protein